jgi:iron complex transport system ATP-binding protein
MSGTPAFETRELTVRYPGAAPSALSKVSMSVPQGTLYTVLGPNGSGKSTLLRALMGGVGIESGGALVDGIPIADWKRKELARLVGVVAQSEAITFPITVRELVAMGRYPHMGALSPERATDSEAISRALERCDVVALTDRFATDLSGGELQRVRIARALAQEPRHLALDEPTASLDIAHEMEILELLRRSVDGGTTVLLVTHHLDAAARFADRMLLLDGGGVAAEGTPAEVLRADVLGRVYGWEVDVREDPVTGSLRVTPLAR